MLSFQNVSYSVLGPKNKRVLVFDDVSFSIKQGEKIAVLGNRGVGKSLLLNMIAGKAHQDSGSIQVDGRISLPLGQSWGVHPTLTGRQNMRFLVRLRGFEDRLGEITSEFERFSELGPFLDKPVSSYPNAMKTRLYQSLFFCLPADFYICDATLGAGDANFKAKAEKYLKKLLEKSGIFFSYPNEKIVREFCEAALVIFDKKITYFNSLDSAYGFFKDAAK